MFSDTVPGCNIALSNEYNAQILFPRLYYCLESRAVPILCPHIMKVRPNLPWVSFERSNVSLMYHYGSQDGDVRILNESYLG